MDALLRISWNGRPLSSKPQFHGCSELCNPKQIFAVLSTCVMSVLSSQLGGMSKVIASVNVLGRVWVTLYLRNPEICAPTAMIPQFVTCSEPCNPKQIFAVLNTYIIRVLNSQRGCMSKPIASVIVVGRVAASDDLLKESGNMRPNSHETTIHGL